MTQALMLSMIQEKSGMLCLIQSKPTKLTKTFIKVFLTLVLNHHQKPGVVTLSKLEISKQWQMQLWLMIMIKMDFSYGQFKSGQAVACQQNKSWKQCAKI